MHKQQVVAIEFPRRQKQKPSVLKKFVRLMVLDYKRARRQSVVIQSVLFEDALSVKSTVVV